MTPHRIHLRGHWNAVSIPGGRTRHSRRFGQPRTLDPGESVWITGEGSAGPATIFLNSQLLGTAEGPFAFDITSALLPRNEIAIDMNLPDPAIGDVAIEIRGPDR